MCDTWSRSRHATNDLCGDGVIDPKPISGPTSTVEIQLALSAIAALAYDPGVDFLILNAVQIHCTHGAKYPLLCELEQGVRNTTGSEIQRVGDR